MSTPSYDRKWWMAHFKNELTIWELDWLASVIWLNYAIPLDTYKDSLDSPVLEQCKDLTLERMRGRIA